MSKAMQSPRWLMVMLFALLCAGARADNLAEDKAKVGFIFNFTKYTEWPAADTPSNNLLVCGLSAQPLAGKLAALRGQQAQGRVIQVRTPTQANEWRDCDVLVITADTSHRIETVLRSTAQHAVLTISDTPGFVEAGGIIGLYLRDGRIRFAINQAAAREAGLKLSSQLLKLAEKVLP